MNEPAGFKPDLSRQRPKTTRRRPRALPALLTALLFASSPRAGAYGVLTHQALIDLSWKSTIEPILLNRFPALTPEQLKKAHAYAYGGCAIQDLGYYPFGNEFFSDLTHYVRSGDFVRSLFRHAGNANELAFAIGALAHYIGDSIGHSVATNPSVAIEFPKLRAKYGPSVSFAENRNAHSQVELAFDVNQVTKGHMPPSRYLRSIGLDVPRRQIAEAFYETYGFEVREVVGLYRPALRTYRFGARSFLPTFIYAEAVLHRRRFPPDTPGAEVDLHDRYVAQAARESGWDRYRKKPGIGIHLLAGVIVILPKIGRLKMLDIKGPNADTGKRYIESVNRSLAAMARILAQSGRTLPAAQVPDRDLDTGERVVPGGYPLTDKTYAKLLARVTKDPSRPIPAGLKQDILRYYADPNAPISTKRNPKHWGKVQAQLQLLTNVPTHAGPE
jgi:hypothetical protein